MPFLPHHLLYIGDCKDCKYCEVYSNGCSHKCKYLEICDPIGGINYWHHKDYETYEEWNNENL